MKCTKHNQPSAGTCQWCGKLICKECIAKTSGKKAYCRECSNQVGEYIERMQLEQIRKERETEEKKKRFSGIFERY